MSFITSVAGVSGATGDFFGPASSTDNAIVRFDGTTGKLAQDSLIIISDLGAITGAKSLNLSDLTASRALVSDGSKNIIASSVTSTELGYVSGVTSAIQTQFGDKVTGPASATDNAIVRYDGTTGKLVQNSSVTIADTTGAINIPATSGARFQAGTTSLNDWFSESSCYVVSSTQQAFMATRAGTDAILGVSNSQGLTGGFGMVQFFKMPEAERNLYLSFYNADTAIGGDTVKFDNAGVVTFNYATILNSLTASRALTLNASKAITVSATTDTELGYVSGVTSAIQTQLDAKVATSGRLKLSRVAVADANYTVLTSDYYVGLTSITASRTFTLPAAASAGTGSILVIKDESGSVSGTLKLIVDGNASETIDGATTFELTSAYESLTLMCNGSNWFII